ncbi:MAG: hypothetical protein V1772_13765, partial [Chloroflexota bacterium]
MISSNKLRWMVLSTLCVLLLWAGARAGRYVWVRRDRVVARVARVLRPTRTETAQPPTAPAPAATATPQPAPTPTRVSPLRALGRRLLVPLVRLGEATPVPAAPDAPPALQGTPALQPTKTPKASRTPKPTATPRVPWPEPLARPGPSKLGLHVQWNNSPDIMEYIRRMKPPVVKAVGDFGFLKDLKEASPTTIVVARLADAASERGFRLEGDPAAAARAFVAAHLETYRANPLVDYWEGPNEPGVQGRMAWYGAFEAERVRAMAEQGLKAAVGSFSTGVPEWDEFEAFLPAIVAARQHGGVF